MDESNTRIPFFTIKLDRLPHYEPEELNFFSVINRLAKVEGELAAITQDVSQLKTTA
jgi:hypothetical protein